jgi:iron complex outermembrane receptor protein
VAQIDVLYGPFDAAYAGNSIGTTINITTRMPDRFEVYADVLAAAQTFDQYATDRTYMTWQAAAGMGDRDGAFSWRLSANHLDSVGQPLAYVTLAQPSTPGAAGTPVTGVFNGRNRTGAPIAIVGAGGIEHQVQNTVTLKAAYDLPDAWQVAYTASIFHQNDDAGAQTYLHDASGAPVYSGSVNIGGFNYNVGASSFSNNVYRWDQTYLAQGLTLNSQPGRIFEWQFAASDYLYLDDNQRVPGTPLPGGRAGGAGTINRLDGTGWYTLDAKGIWRGWADSELSFGLHRDAENFEQTKFNTANWLNGAPGTRASAARGRTATNAIWLEDVWSFAPGFKVTVGGRYEDWRAYDGSNFSAVPALNVKQPKLSGQFFSPKAALAWDVTDEWTLSASWGGAYRMPTVTELYQAVTTGTQLTVPNPDLKPEHANTVELSAEHAMEEGRVRLSLFHETVEDALLSQFAPLVPGSTTLYSFVQNVDRTRAQGIELVAEQDDVLVSGLQLSGSVIYVDGRIVKDPVFPAAIGKHIPQLPPWRANLVATYRPDDRIAFTLAARYSGRSFGTIDNSDPVSRTFQGFGAYFVMDARIRYRIDGNWSASVGVDNLNNDKYFEYHPFPQRTFVMELHYAQ